MLIFLGDGEDRHDLEISIDKHNVVKDVMITGFKPPEDVVKYLNAADVCVVGSHKEGWSIAMLEALACGKPIVSTDVSGARDMIIQGENGYVVKERYPEKFADCIARALRLDAAPASLKIAKKYSTDALKDDFGKIWPPLR